jgi:hypothetical protein
MSDIPVNMFGTNKVGRLMIAVEAIRDEPDMVRKIMNNLIVFNARLNPDAGLIDCVAISEEFDELKSKDQIPTYTSQIHSDGVVEFVRTSFKRNVPDSIKDEIVATIMEKEVDLAKFKQFVLQFDNAKEEDFQEYDETFLEALLIYIDRRDSEPTEK